MVGTSPGPSQPGTGQSKLRGSGAGGRSSPRALEGVAGADSACVVSPRPREAPCPAQGHARQASLRRVGAPAAEAAPCPAPHTPHPKLAGLRRPSGRQVVGWRGHPAHCPPAHGSPCPSTVFGHGGATGHPLCPPFHCDMSISAVSVSLCQLPGLRRPSVPDASVRLSQAAGCRVALCALSVLSVASAQALEESAVASEGRSKPSPPPEFSSQLPNV